MLDWRVPAVGDYFVNEVFGEDTYTDPHLDGVFVDTGFNAAIVHPNMTYASRRALQLAELEVRGSLLFLSPQMLSSRLTPPPFALTVHCRIDLKVFRRICSKLATHGKVLTVSLKGHFSTLADQQGMRMCPKGMAPHNTTPCMPFGEEKAFEVGATPVPFFLS